MSGASKSSTPPEKKSPSVVLLWSVADTTWRMFVPTIGLLVIGRLADGAWGIKPWGMLVGVVIGAGISALLVKKQLEKKI